MDERTAKVRQIENIKKWDGPHGTIWFHSIVLDNGDSGSIGKKKEFGIAIGDEITYTIEPGQGGNKIKQVFAPPTDGDSGDSTSTGGTTYQKRGSGASFALSYAKDVMIAAMPFHQDITTNQWIEATLVAAERFNAFLKEHE